LFIGVFKSESGYTAQAAQEIPKVHFRSIARHEGLKERLLVFAIKMVRNISRGIARGNRTYQEKGKAPP
jgi:hypothetical protein